MAHHSELSARWEQLTRLNVPHIRLLNEPTFLETQSREGLGTAELVIFHFPCFALLRERNTPARNKLQAAACMHACMPCRANLLLDFGEDMTSLHSP